MSWELYAILNRSPIPARIQPVLMPLIGIENALKEDVQADAVTVLLLENDG